MLRTAGPSGAQWPILVQGVRFTAAALHQDGFMIDAGNPGPLILRNNLFGTTGNDRMPQVKLNSNVPGNSLTSRGNVWSGKDAYEKSPFVFVGAGAESVNASISAEVFAGKGRREVTKFKDGDSTPTIHYSRWFQTRNSTPTEITDLRNGWPGARLQILVGDDNTRFRFTKTGRLRGNRGKPWDAQKGDSLTCLFDGKAWHCRS